MSEIGWPGPCNGKAISLQKSQFGPVKVMSSQSHSSQRQPEDRSFTGDVRRVIHEPLDPEIEDLIHSWRRITEPGLRKIALGVIRAMAS